jgi:hypothetical protein
VDLFLFFRGKYLYIFSDIFGNFSCFLLLVILFI